MPDGSSLIALGLETGWELGEGIVDRQLAGGHHHVVGDPLGKWLLDNPMGTRCRVLFVKRRKLLGCKAICHTHERRPQATVHERHLAAYQSQANDVERLVEQLQLVEDGMALRMSPPTSLDRFTSDQLGNVGQRSTRRLQQNAVFGERCHHIHIAILSQSDRRRRSWVRRQAEGVPSHASTIRR